LDKKLAPEERAAVGKFARLARREAGLFEASSE
jgi:hypothetical protein